MPFLYALGKSFEQLISQQLASKAIKSLYTIAFRLSPGKFPVNFFQGSKVLQIVWLFQEKSITINFSRETYRTRCVKIGLNPIVDRPLYGIDSLLKLDGVDIIKTVLLEIVSQLFKNRFYFISITILLSSHKEIFIPQKGI